MSGFPGSPRITGRGAGFSLLAAGLLAAGILRAELGSLLGGSGLAAAVLLAFLGVLREGRRQRRALDLDPEAVSVRMLQGARESETGFSASFRTANRGIPLPIFPGTSAWAEVRLRSASGRKAEGAAALPAPGDEADAIVPGALRRGVFRGPALLASGDAFGFWKSVIVLPGELEAVIPPDASGARSRAPRGAGGERSDLRDLLARGEERFDTRPYLPGDDPRRLHWKLYARFGELFVRPGDLSPPPREAVRILVDNGLPDWLRGQASEAYLDSAASASMGIALTLTERNLAVILSAPGIPDAPVDPAGRLRWLADLAWAEVCPELQDPGPEPLMVLGAPGVKGRPGFLAERRAQGRVTVRLVPGLRPLPERRGLAGIFISEAPAGWRRRDAPDRRIRAAFQQALERERSELGRGGDADVRIV
ncbi:MAG TPA: DUF58 domain-containing protein [Magnetospirillaceae bacterium]|nr:DUF58 domain-containing protein [Magnetospirillaceae bacterium]